MIVLYRTFIKETTMDKILNINDLSVRVNESLVNAISVLDACRAGGFAFLRGAIFTSNREEGKPTIANVWFHSRFSYAALLERKVSALLALSGVDGLEDGAFQKARAALVESAAKTLTGNREDAHRQGHDRCYIQAAPGVIIHLVTEDRDGRKEPVLVEGIPTAESIMVQGLEVRRQVIESGVRKAVKSRPDTLAKKAVERVLFKQGIREPRRYTLKAGRFECLSIDNNTIEEAAIEEED